MGTFIGVIFLIIGAGAGFWLSYSFIFPNDLLSLKLVDMTISDILRILGGLILIPSGGIIGGLIGGSIIGSIVEGFFNKSRVP